MCIRDSRRGVKKNQIIKKIKKTKDMGKICKKKLIKTREEWQMMKNGLLDVFNLPITDHSKLMDYKDCRRTLKEILEGVNNQPVRRNLRKAIFKWKIPKIERTHNKTVCNKLRKSIRKLNTPGIDKYNQISVRASMMDIPLTYLFYKQHNQVIVVDIDTNEHIVVEELLYEVAENYFTRTEIVMHTRVTVSYTHLDVYKRQTL